MEKKMDLDKVKENVMDFAEMVIENNLNRDNFKAVIKEQDPNINEEALDFVTNVVYEAVDRYNKAIMENPSLLNEE